MTHSGPVFDSGSVPPRAPTRTVQMAKAGASFGSALAIVISWSEHHSILWAVVQGFLSWAYVLYYAVTR
ncbi:MAG: hypothetical protein H0W68_11590 [Gemmatimonadaceae bacterium]|nr:hypothetical protein [Gemmatimonadaceae bacterium]